MKTLVLFRGLPGSGKTTLANILSENGRYPVRSADDYFIIDGKYEFNANDLGRAHEWCLQKVRFDMYGSTSKIFVANTFTTEKEMAPYFKIAKEFGYEIHTIIIENRHGNKNVHNVPEETLNKMRSRFSISL